MTEYEAHQEHIRYTHDTYCRIVIRHASFDAARMLAARWKREISLEYLTEEKFVPLSTTDEYFQVPDYGETYPFSVRGQTILLDSCSLAAALAGLPEQTQEEIFLYYFQHLTQKEIGEQSGWTRSTIGRHIQLALKRLKAEMEVLSQKTRGRFFCLTLCLRESGQKSLPPDGRSGCGHSGQKGQQAAEIRLCGGEHGVPYPGGQLRPVLQPPRDQPGR